MGASGCRVKQDGCARMASTPRDTALNNCEYSHTQLILTRMLLCSVPITYCIRYRFICVYTTNKVRSMPVRSVVYIRP